MYKAENNKNLYIETLRGIAIILVVMGHVIGSSPDGGMKIDYPHPLRYLYMWIDYIQMPLFTAIAGWVYALKPLPGYKMFIKKKMIRLLIPMAVVGTTYFLLQYVIPGTNGKSELSQMWEIYIFPYTLFWYLPSLFLIFAFQGIIDRQHKMDTFHLWCMFLLLSWLLCLSEYYLIPKEIPNLFSFRGALNQLPYFVVGVGLQRFKKYLLDFCCVKTFCLLGAVIGVALLQCEWIYGWTGQFWYECLQLICICAILALLFLAPLHHPIRLFVWVGQYSYAIYLLHGFGTSGGRIILNSVGINATYVVFVCVTFMAILGPIIADKILSLNKWTRLLFLGKQ